METVFICTQFAGEIKIKRWNGINRSQNENG